MFITLLTKIVIIIYKFVEIVENSYKVLYNRQLKVDKYVDNPLKRVLGEIINTNFLNNDI